MIESNDVLFMVLTHVGVGDVIKEGVKMAYARSATRLVINNDLREKIPVLSFVRQGRLSPLLFSLYLEIFCESIATSRCICGYQLSTCEVEILAYADIAVFCTDKTSVSEVIRLTGNFCDATGAAVSWQQSNGLWHRTWNTQREVS